MFILVPEANAEAFHEAVPALSLAADGLGPMAALDWPAVRYTDGTNPFRGWDHPWTEVDGEWVLHQGEAFGVTVHEDIKAAGVTGVVREGE